MYIQRACVLRAPDNMTFVVRTAGKRYILKRNVLAEPQRKDVKISDDILVSTINGTNHERSYRIQPRTSNLIEVDGDLIVGGNNEGKIVSITPEEYRPPRQRLLPTKSR